MRSYSMRKCAQLGCLAGGAVVQVVGAEMTPDSWRWLFARSAPQRSSSSLHPRSFSELRQRQTVCVRASAGRSLTSVGSIQSDVKHSGEALPGERWERSRQPGWLHGMTLIQLENMHLIPLYPLFSRLHGELAANVVRDSASAVQKEMLEAYGLIERLGRGVVYYGSARLKSTSVHWGRAQALGRDVAKLLGCTTWSGGGPGMMEAATLGTSLFYAYIVRRGSGLHELLNDEMEVQ